MPPANDPQVGVIYERDRHPAAKRFADLLDEESAGRVLCDDHIALSEALSRDWDNDAHLILYSLHDEDDNPIFARVSKRSPFVAELIQRGGAVKVWLLVFDHDLPKAQGLKQEWTEEGLGEFVQGLAQADLPPPTYWYSTLHGSRFVYVLSEPIDHLRAEAMSHAIIEQFKVAGIELDTACTDWTRLFRLPSTIREDTGERYKGMQLGPGEPLDPSTITVDTTATVVENFAEVRPYEGTMPDVDQVRELLITKSEKGREIASDWVKTAKQYLQGRDAYPVCFEDAPIDTSKGWNNGVVKLVGQIIGMTARQDNASPEGIFAILYGALEQLQIEENRTANQTEWFSKTWDIITRMWANEQAQIDAENQQREAQIIAAKAVRSELLEKIKAKRPQDVPADTEAAEAFLKQRMIASDGRLHWIMRPDASYNIKPIPDSMLVPMIRELGMEDVIETSEMRGKSWVTRSGKSILDDHATPIISVQCSSREPIAYIEGAPGYRTLHLPVHRLNPVIKPIFSADVDQWLRKFFGEKYDLGIEWMSWALEVGAPICSLNLYGAPGTGKGLFVQGLAECFEGERMNDGRVMGKFNEGLLHTPIINCDEGVPQIKSDEALTLDQAFRSFVSGGNITIRSMYQNPFSANVYPRIVFTSNDRDILKSIVGHRDLTDDDIRAIELRLLSIHVTSEAREFLTARGNYAFTAGWVHGKHKSKYTLANHILYLHEHRKPAKHGSGRLLVEGEVQTALVRGMRLRSQSAQSVLKTLVKMIESPQTKRHGLHIDDILGRVWVTPSGVVQYIETALAGIEQAITLPRSGQILRQFAPSQIDEISKSTPPGAQRGRWVEIDLGLLYEETERYGMTNTRLTKLLMLQPDGLHKIATVAAHTEQASHD